MAIEWNKHKDIGTITKAQAKESEQSTRPTVWSPDPEPGIIKGLCVANPAPGAPLIVTLKTGEPVNESTTGLYSGGNLRHE